LPRVPWDVSSSPVESARNSYALTEDTYGLQNATFMSATRSDASIVLRAAIATGMTDPDFTTVFRIDIPQPTQVSGPGSYAIGGDGATIPKFPGEILVFNGHKSSLLNTASGTITFTSYGKNAGEVLAGNFAITVEDQNSDTMPRPAYAIKGNFSLSSIPPARSLLRPIPSRPPRPVITMPSAPPVMPSAVLTSPHRGSRFSTERRGDTRQVHRRPAGT
jgi:hypothetical protein